MNLRWRKIAGIVSTAVLALQVAAGDAAGVDKLQVLPPGYGVLQFNAASAGSYSLPPMGMATDGEVLDSQGKRLHLFDSFGKKIVLLSFIYTRCSDVSGCPLATLVLHKVQRRLRKEPDLRGKLQLVTMSFDPENDTPEVMRAYAASFQNAGVDWRFLTAASQPALQPILDGYNQQVQKNVNNTGEYPGTFSHILRVFLIDPKKNIRNIYSVAFLHPDTLVNDVKTLLQENAGADASGAVSDRGKIIYVPPVAKESKSGQIAPDASTSTALTLRTSKPVDLMQWIVPAPLGLPPVPAPVDNPVSREKIALGRRLFFDRRLSLNNTISCAMCHIPEQGFSSHELATSVGIEGRTVRRNAPTIYNSAYLTRLFHDGREYSLEQQVWGPLLAVNEMGNPSVGYVVEKIRGLAEYSGQFEALFGRGPGMETIGMAIASYERALNSGGSDFDHWYYGHQVNALKPAARRGFELFTGKAGCVRCHSVGKKSALFTDNRLHNTGIGYRAAMFRDLEKQVIQLAPGVAVTVDNGTIAAVSENPVNDLGLYEITQQPDDRWKYKTPTLRNIALSAPYMHDGSLASLRQVVAFYNNGGEANENLDALIKPLGLSGPEIDELIAFLQALTGDNIAELVADAVAAPVGDVH